MSVSARVTHMNRHTARENVFTLLYEAAFHPDREAAEIYETAKEDRAWEDDPYLRDTFYGAVAHKAELDERIESYSRGWKKERISPVSLAIMELAAYEMLYCTDIPLRVSLNEAIELVKTYDEEGARAFVNGILNAIAQEAKAGRNEEE